MDTVRFGELYAIPSGNGLSRPSAVRGEGYRMIGMGELFTSDIISDMEMDRVQMSERELKTFLVEEGDLLFARQSLVAEGAGKCSIVKRLSEPTTYESHLIRVRLDQKKCNPWFYYYLFRLPNNPIKAIVNQCAQAGIRGNELIKVKVPLLDRLIQDRIASILFAYDNLIEVNNKRIKVLEQMAENLYKEWFVRFRFPGHETAEFENGIPRGWNITRCKDIVPVLTGKKDANYGDDGGPYPFFTCAQEPIQAPDYSFDCAAVLLAGNCDLNAKVYKGKFEAYQRTYVLSPHNITHLFLLYYVIKDNVERLKQASTGAAISFITKGMIERIHFLLPPNELLVRFHGIMDDLYTQKDVLMKLNKNLIKQRDLLLPRLMSGKLEV